MSDLPFGALRSLMQADAYDVAWRHALCDLLERAHAAAPDVYLDEWVPYLQGFAPAWEVPLRRTWGPDDLARWQALAPFATFDHVDWGARLDDLIATLEADPRVEVLLCERDAPASQELIAGVHAELGFELDEAFLSFYRVCNGLELVWVTRDPGREEESVTGIFWNRSYATEGPCGSVAISPLEDLLDRPPAFEPFAGYGDYEVRALGGWDDTLLRECLRDVDDYESAQEGYEYSYYQPALVLHPRFPSPPVLMTDDSAAAISDSRPMLAHDYLLFVLATLGQVDVRLGFMNKRSGGNYDVFVPPPDWASVAPSPADLLDLLYGQPGDDAAARWAEFTDTPGVPTSQTPYARYNLPTTQDPFVVGDDPTAGFTSTLWAEVPFAQPPPEGAYPDHVLLPTAPLARYLLQGERPGRETADQKLPSLVGEPVVFTWDAVWTIGVLLAARGEQLALLVPTEGGDRWHVVHADRDTVGVIGRARYTALHIARMDEAEVWRPRQRLAPIG
jgi:hypothetical protein